MRQTLDTDTKRGYVAVFRVSADTPTDAVRMRTAAVEVISRLLDDRVGCVCTDTYVQDR